MIRVIGKNICGIEMGEGEGCVGRKGKSDLLEKGMRNVEEKKLMKDKDR